MADITVVTNARAAHQHSMIGYGDLLLDALRQTSADVCEVRGASLFARTVTKGRAGKLARNMDRFLVTPAKLAGHRTGILHVVDPGNAVYLPLIRHRASVCTVHDMIPYLARDGRLEGFRPTHAGSRLMDRILWQLERVHHVVCVSHATRRDLLQFVDIEPERVSVIRNVVCQHMSPAASEERASFRARYGLPADVPFVLHVGRNFYKNRPRVVEAFARVQRKHPDVRLVLVGALEPAMQEQIARLGIEERLHVLDHVPAKQMQALYSAAAVLLFPSLYEGFGLPVLEAQMCGTPVICSNAGALPEAAGNAAQLVDSSDVNAMADATLRVLEDPELAKRLAAAGIDNAQKYERSSWYRAHLDLYVHLLDKTDETRCAPGLH